MKGKLSTLPFCLFIRFLSNIAACLKQFQQRFFKGFHLLILTKNSTALNIFVDINYCRPVQEDDSIIKFG